MTPMACGLSTANKSRWQHRDRGRRSCYVQDPGYLCPNNALMPYSKRQTSRHCRTITIRILISTRVIEGRGRGIVIYGHPTPGRELINYLDALRLS